MFLNLGQVWTSITRQPCIAGIATMCGDCTSFTALSPRNGCRWRRCWTTAKNWLNSTSAHCVRCHPPLPGGMRSYVCDVGVRLGAWLRLSRGHGSAPHQLSLIVHPEHAELAEPILRFGVRRLAGGRVNAPSIVRCGSTSLSLLMLCVPVGLSTSRPGRCSCDT